MLGVLRRIGQHGGRYDPSTVKRREDPWSFRAVVFRKKSCKYDTGYIVIDIGFLRALGRSSGSKEVKLQYDLCRWQCHLLVSLHACRAPLLELRRRV